MLFLQRLLLLRRRRTAAGLLQLLQLLLQRLKGRQRLLERLHYSVYNARGCGLEGVGPRGRRRGPLPRTGIFVRLLRLRTRVLDEKANLILPMI